MSLNKVLLIGNVGNITQHDKVTRISLATTESYKDKSGQAVKETAWHSLVFFGRLAEIANQYVGKGSKIYIEGKVKYDKYTDKAGVEKTSTSIIVANMQMLDSKAQEPVDLKPENYDYMHIKNKEKTASIDEGLGNWPF